MEKTKIEDNPLLNYGIDLTQKAREGKLDKVFGRDKEIIRATQVLSRRKKNNLLLVGNPGCGKTSIAEMIAQKIVDKDIPFMLQDKTIFSLDIPAIIAGTQFRGQMEERLKAITDYLAKNPQIILFIDEIHIIMESSGSNTMSIANIFKPYLTNGTLQVIGATTTDEAKKYFEKDAAMDRRFQKLIIEDPTPEDTVKILENCKTQYEDFHQVIYPQDMIEKIPFMAKRYLIDRHLPDSAIDILDEVGSRATIDSMVVPTKINKLEEELNELAKQKTILISQEKWSDIIELKKQLKKVETSLDKELTKWETKRNENRTIITELEILKVVSSMSKIPLDKLSTDGGDKVAQLEKAFKNLSGQDEAKSKIMQALKRSVVGISSETKPVASFLFLGPTGVGKTEIAKILANTWFDGSLIRFDMSEFMEKHNVSQMVGAPNGYVGYEKGGRFEEIRRKPHSVVLFDEVEKADPEVLNILLHILDEGEMVDAHGKKINFRNTIIIMTSNLGVKENKIKSVGFGRGVESTANDLRSKSLEAAKKHFTPEIWNRIGDAVVFNQLDKENIIEIVDLEINKVKTRLVESKNINLKINKKVKEFLADEGYSPDYGARFLARAVQEHLVDALTEYLLINENLRDITLSASMDEGKVVFK